MVYEDVVYTYWHRCVSMYVYPRVLHCDILICICVIVIVCEVTNVEHMREEIKLNVNSHDYIYIIFVRNLFINFSY